MSTSVISLVQKDLGLSVNSVKNTIDLLLTGATVPFIARYRKEVTGSLDEVQIGLIKEKHAHYNLVEERKAFILQTIEEQGKLTAELKKQITDSWNLTEIEDLYLPYKPKRKTRATIAREKGLEPLSDIIWKQNERQIETKATQFLSNDVPSVEEALKGARDIIAEQINEHATVRNLVRASFSRSAVLSVKVLKGKKEEGAKFSDYFEFAEPLKKCPSHRILAIMRGANEGILSIDISPDKDETLNRIDRLLIKSNNSCADQMELAIEDSYKRLMKPSIETEFANEAKEKADKEAIEVFAKNLRQLLLAAPLGQKRVLALDPGYRTGCKLVCLDAQGELLHHTAIFPHPPQNEKQAAIRTLKELVKQYDIDAIAVGNGTAGRESEAMVQQIDFGKKVFVFLVNESGASIYSASAVAREEFPNQDVTVRGAISIGRRLVDPLAELVKIDAKSIGVGQYQHDVNQSELKKSLDTVVESCVNAVGVNVNTASKQLLSYVSGLGPALAQNIINYRSENGEFKTRQELKKVSRLGDRAFEQAAGFLRIAKAKNILDNTAVHPERYKLVETIAKDVNVKIEGLVGNESVLKNINWKSFVNEAVGMPTLEDIKLELQKPGRDPREQVEEFQFAEGIYAVSDLKEGMVLPGIVTNITNFGAFVDVGVKQDGLVHISQIVDRFIQNPAEVLSLQQKVRVMVTEIDMKRNRVALSIRQAKGQ